MDIEEPAISESSLPNDFIRDIRSWARLPPEVFLSAARMLADQETIEIAVDANDVDREVEGLHIDRDTYFRVLGQLQFARTYAARNGWRPEHFIGQIAAAGVDISSLRDVLIDILANLLTDFSPKASVAATFYEFLPIFWKARTRCISMPTFSNDYKVSDRPSDYLPRIDEVVPAILMRLDLLSTASADDVDDTNNVTFVISKKDLLDLQNQVSLALKQLDAFNDEYCTNQN